MINLMQKLARGCMILSKYTEEIPSVEWDANCDCYKMVMDADVSEADSFNLIDYGWEPSDRYEEWSFYLKKETENVSGESWSDSDRRFSESRHHGL